MLTRSAIFFPIVLALLLALLTFWINQTVENQGPKIDGSNRHDPDYTMNNFVTTQTDVTGKLRYVLAAAEMVHYPDDDSTVLQRPRFTQYTTNKPYTQIEGLRGYVSGNGDEVELVDNVKVVRQAFEGKGEMQVLTEKLLILPNQDLVKTNAPVVIKQMPKTVIYATGMIYDKKNKTVHLLSRVKAHYEKPIARNFKPVKKQQAAPTLSLANKPITAEINNVKANKIAPLQSATKLNKDSVNKNISSKRLKIVKKLRSSNE